MAELRTPDHVEAGNALLAFLNGDVEPNTYQRLIPPADWGHAKAAGSGNIPLMATVARYLFNPGDLYARALLVTLGKLNRTLFMLSEPWSGIYGMWIFLSWLLALFFAKRRKHQDVVDALTPLVRQWLGVAAAMATTCPPGNLNETDRKQGLGKVVLCLAGCRWWGHGHGYGFGIHELWRVAAGLEEPKSRDDWEQKAMRLALPLLREMAAEFKGLTADQIFERLPQFGAREDFEFYGYADGSRVCIMGTDEPEFDDEDDNGNTLGHLVKVVDQGRKLSFSAPEWPNPVDGDTRIRQTAVRADADRHPTLKGWLLFHSHIGRRKVGDFYETDCLEPPAPRVFAWRMPKGVVGWINLLKIGGGGVGQLPPDVPGSSPGGGTGERPGIPPVPTIPTPPPPKRSKSKLDPAVIIGLLAAAVVIFLLAQRGCGGG